jgi:hypothetical protein
LRWECTGWIHAAKLVAGVGNHTGHAVRVLRPLRRARGRKCRLPRGTGRAGVHGHHARVGGARQGIRIAVACRGRLVHARVGSRTGDRGRRRHAGKKGEEVTLSSPHKEVQIRNLLLGIKRIKWMQRGTHRLTQTPPAPQSKESNKFKYAIQSAKLTATEAGVYCIPCDGAETDAAACAPDMVLCGAPRMPCACEGCIAAPP